jgi:hypothetical protein
LLRGYVIDGSHHSPGVRQFGLLARIAICTQTGQPHVQNLDGPLFIHEQIRWFDVPMHDAVFMSGF